MLAFISISNHFLLGLPEALPWDVGPKIWLPSARSQCRPGAKCLRFLFKASSQAGPRKSQSHLPQAMRKVYQNMGAMRTIYVVVIIYPRQ